MSNKANFSTINEAIRETYEGPSWWKQTWRWMKHMSIAFLLGAGGGAYEAYSYEHPQTLHIRDLAMRGFCGHKDADENLYWFTCPWDSYVADQEHSRDAIEDAATASIMSDMAAKDAKKRGTATKRKGG